MALDLPILKDHPTIKFVNQVLASSDVLNRKNTSNDVKRNLVLDLSALEDAARKAYAASSTKGSQSFDTELKNMLVVEGRLLEFSTGLAAYQEHKTALEKEAAVNRAAQMAKREEGRVAAEKARREKRDAGSKHR